MSGQLRARPPTRNKLGEDRHRFVGWEHFAENAHWFVFEWVPLRSLPELAPSQGDLLHHVLTAPSPDTESSVH